MKKITYILLPFSLLVVLFIPTACEDAADDLADAIAGGNTVSSSDVIGTYLGASSYFYANGDCSGDLATEIAGFHDGLALQFNAGTMGFPSNCEDADGNVTFGVEATQCDGEYNEAADIATWAIVNDTTISITLSDPTNNDFPINTFTITETGLTSDFLLAANCDCQETIDDDNCPDTQTACDALGDAAEWREAVCSKINLTKQ